jgi:MYXO-CTERM domain-containing protein
VGEPHADGLIWAGAMWDLRKALIATHGTNGAAVTDAIFAGVLSTGPVLDQVLDEALLADDDDGDLANGTPNQCEILAAFSAHGLLSRTGGLTHVEVLGPRLAGEATPVFVGKPEPQAALCPLPEVTAARVRYTIDDGATQTIAMSATTGGFAATLPAQAGSHVVRYWFEGDAGPLTFRTPREGEESPFGFWSGPQFVVWEEDFETLPAWEHDGNEDDWEIGAPLGLADDPADAFSGAYVLGNDLSDDGFYEPYAFTWIESPVIDCRGCRNTHLQLRRWLNVEDAIYDQSRILVNGELVYVNPWNGLGGAMPKDSRWVFHDIDVSDVADGERFTIRFSLETDEGLEFGGWTVDDVRIVTPTEPHYDPPSCGCSTTERTAPFGSLLVLALLLLRRR